MNWTTGLSWMSAIGTGGESAEAGDEADRAGMGTAFGLDASMPPEREWGDASAERSGAPELTVWERRLAGRSRL